MARPNRRRKRTTRSVNRRSAMVLGKVNYLLLTACVVIIIIGFTLMRLENEVDGFVSLYISPIILMIGYLGVFIALLYPPRLKAPSYRPPPSRILAGPS